MRLENIQDGTSNTIFCGINCLPTTAYANPNANIFSWDETLFAGGYGGTGRNSGTVIQDSPNVSYAGNWGGPYSSGCLFALCDGSVRAIAFGTDVTPWLTPNGGEIDPLMP